MIPLPALVAKDDPAIRTPSCELLDDAGYRPTLVATDGREALTVLRHFPQLLVVLLDLGLPPLDGAGLLRRVAGAAWQRRHVRHAHVPVTASYKTAVPDLVCLLVIQAASRLPAATPDQRLIGTAYAARYRHR